MDAWHPLRVRRRIVVGLWLGWLPFGGLLMTLQDRFLPSPWAALIGVAYLAGFMIAGVWVSGLRCPRCHHDFAPLFVWKPRAIWNWRCDSCRAEIGDPLDDLSGVSVGMR
jgi:hypothetical protein